MIFKDAWGLIKTSVSAWIDDYAPSMGAALAYYTVFSIAPLLIIVIAVAGFFFGQEAVQGEVAAQLRGLIGDQGAEAIEGLVESAREPTQGIVATVVSVVLLIMGATTVFGELQSALDRIWRVPAPEKGGLWNMLRTRFLSFGMVLGLGFMLLVSLLVSAGLAAFGTWWGGAFAGWEILLQVLNLVISLVIITGLFAMIYRLMPRARIAWRDVWIGAAVTALLFEAGKLLIGLYLGKSGVTSGFGAAGSLVVLLVWVYYSAQIFLLGAEFTWAYAHQFGSKVDEPSSSAVSVVPRRSGMGADVNTQAAGAETAVAMAPGAVAESSPAAIGSSSVSPHAVIDHHSYPLKALTAIVAVGLVLGALLGRVAPPARIFSRWSVARARRLF